MAESIDIDRSAAARLDSHGLSKIEPEDILAIRLRFRQRFRNIRTSIRSHGEGKQSENQIVGLLFRKSNLLAREGVEVVGGVLRVCI